MFSRSSGAGQLGAQKQPSRVRPMIEQAAVNKARNASQEAECKAANPPQRVYDRIKAKGK